MDKRKTLAAVIVFYSIAVLLRYLTNKTSILSTIDNAFLKTILQGMGPAIAALVVFKFFDFHPVMKLQGNFKNLFVPAIIFWGLPILLIITVAYFTKGIFPFFVVLSILIYGLLEEIGWRGFLQQALKPLPKFVSILIVAVLWFIWHLNFELSSSNLIFFGILVLGSWGIGKVADKTYSLLAVSAFHSLNNFFTDLNTPKIIILIVLTIIWVITIVCMDKLEKKNMSLNPS